MWGPCPLAGHSEVMLTGAWWGKMDIEHTVTKQANKTTKYWCWWDGGQGRVYWRCGALEGVKV